MRVLILFYGHPNVNRRSVIWNQVLSFIATSAQPIVMIGDFNQVLYSYEKHSKVGRPIQGAKVLMNFIMIMDATVSPCGSSCSSYSEIGS